MSWDRLGGRTAGLLLPTRDRAMAGDWDAGPLLDIAQRAEAFGFDSVWAGDSITARPRLEPLTLLAAVAARTHDVVVGTAALTAALRPSLPTAAAVATLDRVAAGRLVLGLGAGFPYPETEAEFAAVGVPFVGRMRRLEATVDVWRKAWRGETAEGFPAPAAAGSPPLWLAGAGEGALRLAARAFDGWLPYLPDPAAYREASCRIEDLALGAGRDPGDVARALYVTVLVDGAADELDQWCRGYYGIDADVLSSFQAVVTGSVAVCVEKLAGFASVGLDHLVVRIGSVAFDQQLDATAEIVRQWRAL